MKKSKIAVLALCGLLTCGGAIGGAYALYSGYTQDVENTFTIKAGSSNETDSDKVGAVKEDKWDPDNADDLAPNQIVDKNPVFTSNAEYEAYVIIKVDVPTVIMRLAGETNAAVHDAVTLVDVDYDNWEQLASRVSDTAGTDSVYYFGYLNTLSKGQNTTELFQAIQVPDIDELTDNFTDSVDVSATIIQAEGYDSVSDAFEALGL